MEQDEISQQFEQHVTAIINSFTQALQMKLMYGAREAQAKTAQTNAQAQAVQQQAKADNSVAEATEQLNAIKNGAVSSDKDRPSNDSDYLDPDAPAPDDASPDLAPGDVADVNAAELKTPVSVAPHLDSTVRVSLPAIDAARIGVFTTMDQSLAAPQYFYRNLGNSAQTFASQNGLQSAAVLKAMKQIASASGLAQDQTLMAAFDGLGAYLNGVTAMQIGVNAPMAASATQMTADVAGKAPVQAPAPVIAPAPQPGLGR